MLEGSVRRSGERLRITGQLIDATFGAHLWADRFEGGLRDVFELQDRVSESVVAAIEPTLQSAEIGRRKHKPVTPGRDPGVHAEQRRPFGTVDPRIKSAVMAGKSSVSSNRCPSASPLAAAAAGNE